jgi:hypothetical protein
MQPEVSNANYINTVFSGFSLSLLQNARILLQIRKYSETFLYHSWMYHFPRSIIQFLWSPNKSYFIYAPPLIIFLYPSFFCRTPIKIMNQGFTATASFHIHSSFLISTSSSLESSFWGHLGQLFFLVQLECLGCVGWLGLLGFWFSNPARSAQSQLPSDWNSGNLLKCFLGGLQRDY